MKAKDLYFITGCIFYARVGSEFLITLLAILHLVAFSVELIKEIKAKKEETKDEHGI